MQTLLAPAEASDEALLELVRERQIGALRALYQRHGGALLASARVMERHRPGVDAEQAVVDVFTSLWQAPPPSTATHAVQRHLLRQLGRCAADARQP